MSDRPTRHSPEVLRAAAAEIAIYVAKWCEEEVSDDLINQIIDTIGYGEHDGYKLAREFERITYVDGGEELVEAFSSAYVTVEHHLAKAEQRWVAETGWTPSFQVGDTVRCRHGVGTVRSVDADRARYGVHVPPQPETSQWIVLADDIQAASTVETSAAS